MYYTSMRKSSSFMIKALFIRCTLHYSTEECNALLFGDDAVWVEVKHKPSHRANGIQLGRRQIRVGCNWNWKPFALEAEHSDLQIYQVERLLVEARARRQRRRRVRLQHPHHLYQQRGEDQRLEVELRPPWNAHDTTKDEEAIAAIRRDEKRWAHRATCSLRAASGRAARRRALAGRASRRGAAVPVWRRSSAACRRCAKAPAPAQRWTLVLTLGSDDRSHWHASRRTFRIRAARYRRSLRSRDEKHCICMDNEKTRKQTDIMYNRSKDQTHWYHLRNNTIWPVREQFSFAVVGVTR